MKQILFYPTTEVMFRYVLGRMGTNGRFSLGGDVGVHYLKLQSAVMACIAK
jgi:hypothetical protein